MTSIRRTLLVWLLLGLAAVAVLATVATYFDTRREIGELFDLQLKQLAYSTRVDDLLRGRQPSISGPGADRTAGVSEIVTQIWDRDGVLVYYSRPGTGLPVPATEGYSDVVQGGRAWRVYTHVEGRHALQVAHALDERREIAAQSALRTLLPLAALIPFLGVLIWYAVGRGLRPLETMSRAVAKRQPDAMAPLAENGLPEELRPLAGSLNALLVRLDDALNAQRRFTADAAHELRTPLAALKLQVELVERAPNAAARSAALGELEQGVDRASHLVEQLLAMARLEPEAMARNFGDCDLVALAKDSIVARAVLAADKRIDLGLARATPVRVRADAASVSMLLANLLDNALRYTPKGGRIDVAVDDDGGHAVLTVADTGPGIEPGERERVFDRFHRGANAGESSKQNGSGLGLSIVKRIVDAHGAAIALDAGPEGRGLAVKVRFPAVGDA
ncbi:MAG TPA: ATP-binding protein [Casimicrobiaceae bacterium]|nr:ATP-binding protein [Casimicrobiaceae bacterium]